MHAVLYSWLYIWRSTDCKAKKPFSIGYWKKTIDSIALIPVNMKFYRDTYKNIGYARWKFQAAAGTVVSLLLEIFAIQEWFLFSWASENPLTRIWTKFKVAIYLKFLWWNIKIVLILAREFELFFLVRILARRESEPSARNWTVQILAREFEPKKGYIEPFCAL